MAFPEFATDDPVALEVERAAFEVYPLLLKADNRVLRDQYELPDTQSLIGASSGATEVVIPPRSPLIGEHLFPGMTTPSGDLVVLGLQRAGEPVRGKPFAHRPGIQKGPVNFVRRGPQDSMQTNRGHVLPLKRRPRERRGGGP